MSNTHVFIKQLTDGNYQIECHRCGGRQTVKTPVSLTVFTRRCVVFRRTHDGCGPVPALRLRKQEQNNELD